MDKNHNLLNNIVEGAKDAIYAKDLKGYYTMINPAGALLIGKSVKDIIGKDDMDLFSPETAHQIMERDQSVIASGKADDFEETVTSSGITRTYLITKFPNRDHLGNTIGLIGISRDISDCKLTEDNLRQRTELVKLQHEITLTANEAPTVEEAMKFCLTRICNYTGWPIGHVYIPNSSGKLLPTDIWHTRDKKKFKKFREITLKTTFTIGEGLPGRVLRDARPHWIIDVTKDPGFIRTKLKQKSNVKGAFAFPVLEKKKVVAVLEFFSEDVVEPDMLIMDTITQLATQLGRVTERKRAEEVVKESESKYRSLFKNMLNGFAYHKILVDENNKPVDYEFLEVNNAFEILTGLKNDFVKGRKVTEVIPDIRDFEPNLIETYGKVALSGVGTHFDIYFGPLERWFSISAYCPKKGYFVAIFDNITEEKKAEKLLQEQKKVLEQKNIALNELLGQIELEKQYIKDNVVANAENLLLPIVQKLRLTGRSSKYVQLLEKNIQELASSFGTKLIKEETKLTSKEIEICNMIKHGLTSKEIASLLNITLGTAGRHRNNIRRKLGIINKECNLSSFLDRF